MKKQTGIIGIVLALLLSLCSIQSPVQAAGFVDVPSRAVEEVNYLADGNIAKGSSDKIFNSERTITRAESIILIGRVLQLNGTPRKTVFRDVSSASASGYIQSAYEKGIISNTMPGVSKGNFYPNQAITRGEMAVIIANAFNYSYGGTASGAAKALMDRGVADGIGGGSFGSEQSIKRADFAVFLARAINPEFRTKENSADFSVSRWSNSPDLNIRKGPSTAFESVGKLSDNQQVTAAHSVGGWTYIKAGSITGFVSTAYTRTTEERPEIPTGSADSKLSGQTIILDPGHGGTDPGAIGFGLHEADVVLDTGLKVKSLLKQTPFNVQMTRSTDTFIALSGRTAFAKNNKGNIFVSIHANASTGSGNGTETYYYSSATNPHVTDSKLLASKIQERMLSALQLKDRGVKRTPKYYVLKYNSMPATLAELGFIDNKTDNAKLKSEYWRNEAAKAIYYGILDYYKAKGYDVNSLYEIAK